MDNEQLKKLLSMYKKAVQNNLTANDFILELQAAKIELDKSFILEGKENENIGEYINEIYELQKLTENEHA